MDTFHIQPVKSPAGEEQFTVILTRDGEIKGGDHHWLTREGAERAMRLYELDPVAHGMPESVLRRSYFGHFKKSMFAS